jgi:hypothetical protein
MCSSIVLLGQFLMSPEGQFLVSLDTSRACCPCCHVRVWRAGAYRLHLSIPAPLNPACKPLSWLARDLEAEPPAGAAESNSIAGKARSCSSLARLLAIICVIRQ